MHYQIIIPRNAYRGGIESLYQLANSLSKTKNKITLLFTPNYRDLFFSKGAIPNEMEKYNNQFIIDNDLVDKDNTTIIVPEIYTFYLQNIKKSKKCIYWLSVDNYFIGNKINTSNLRKVLRGKYGIGNFINRYYSSPMPINEIRKSNIHHIAQSEYAKVFIKVNFGVNPNLILDYIDEIPDFDESFFNLSKRKKIIAYNPLKGASITRKLISEYDSDFKFVPIENMTHSEVRDFLLKTSIYIDFGEHPGRDRIPREAILCGCCVIVGLRGSASFRDIPILDHFKISNDKEIVPRFINVVNKLKDLSNCKTEFMSAYNIIKEDKKNSLEAVKQFNKNMRD